MSGKLNVTLGAIVNISLLPVLRLSSSVVPLVLPSALGSLLGLIPPVLALEMPPSLDPLPLE